MPGAKSKGSVLTPCHLCTPGEKPHRCRAAVLRNAALAVDAIMSCGINRRGSLTFADDGRGTKKGPSVWQGCVQTDGGTKRYKSAASDLLGPVARQRILRRYVAIAVSPRRHSKTTPGFN